jgi:excisionase family DNA binding protein
LIIKEKKLVEQLYTVKEVSQILKVNVHRVYDLIRSGMLPALKLGSLKVRKEALERFLAEYEGYDLTDLNNINKLDLNKIG